MPTYDVASIGGGIVGLATAYRLTEQYSDTSVVVLEKENRVAAHQTSHNSGVIHSGVFYEPGSLKAETGRKGRSLFMPLRKALTGQSHGPDMASMLVLIGRDKAAARLAAAAG